MIKRVHRVYPFEIAAPRLAVLGLLSIASIRNEFTSDALDQVIHVLFAVQAEGLVCFIAHVVIVVLRGILKAGASSSRVVAFLLHIHVCLG